jgi:hypothetical protein
MISMPKGGSAAVFKEGQATAAGWLTPIAFQTNVGIKCDETGTCDPENAPTQNDPTSTLKLLPPASPMPATKSGWALLFLLIANIELSTSNVQRRRFDTVVPIQRRRDMLVKEP